MRLNYIDNIDCLEGLAEVPDKSVDLIVTDPFMGSATTAVAAMLEGCNYIGFEMDPIWAEKGAERVAATLDELLEVEV